MNTYLMTATYWPKTYLYWPGNFFPAASFLGMIGATLLARALTLTVEAK